MNSSFCFLDSIKKTWNMGVYERSGLWRSFLRYRKSSVPVSRSPSRRSPLENHAEKRSYFFHWVWSLRPSTFRNLWRSVMHEHGSACFWIYFEDSLKNYLCIWWLRRIAQSSRECAQSGSIDSFFRYAIDKSTGSVWKNFHLWLTQQRNVARVFGFFWIQV